MNILTGLDLARVADVDDLAVDDSARNGVWTENEQRTHQGYPERRAGQWAAKEAVMKVLGQGIGQLSPIDIEIVNDEGMPPRVVLHGSALSLSRRLGITSLSISITHEHGAAAAVAVALAQGRSSHDE